MATNITEPTKIGLNIKFHLAPVSIITKGFAPAGGCTVLVICITAIEILTPKASEYHVLPIKYKQHRPIKAVIKCPPIIFLGWASGLSGTPKANTQVAPNGAISNGVSVEWDNKVINEMAINPPNKE